MIYLIKKIQLGLNCLIGSNLPSGNNKVLLIASRNTIIGSLNLEKLSKLLTSSLPSYIIKFQKLLDLTVRMSLFNIIISFLVPIGIDSNKKNNDLATSLQTCLEYEDQNLRTGIPLNESNKSPKINVILQLMQDMNNHIVYLTQGCNSTFSIFTDIYPSASSCFIFARKSPFELSLV